MTVECRTCPKGASVFKSLSALLAHYGTVHAEALAAAGIEPAVFQPKRMSREMADYIHDEGVPRA